jgi:hypothetical protein
MPLKRSRFAVRRPCPGLSSASLTLLLCGVQVPQNSSLWSSLWCVQTARGGTSIRGAAQSAALEHGRSRIAQIRRPRPPPAASAAVPQARSRCIRGFHGGARFGRRGEATGSAARVRLACPPDAHEHMLGRRIRGRQQGAHGLGCVPVPCHAGLGSPSAALSARECCVCGVSGTQHRAVLWFTYEFNHVPDDRLSNG